ncbi:penicillin-binding transpeptidase domain-containing protein [Luteimonas aquatica]|uniref:penicillin-binding transpeptidase domain-containing protein n=1 Tax=Luteimonas aquatica TaxID=450364 RepID=UPI001F5AC74D|nr:penicillin-binding transpeptidase domain-containing protein [Luteimonas aquatica]
MLPLFFALACGHVQAAPPHATPAAAEAARRFAEYGHAGAWLVQRDGEPARLVYDGAAFDAKPQLPASTFKVLLALVALETGALRSADEVIPWDGHTYAAFPEWKTDMALRQAMQTSSESYFRIVAARIGRARLADWVQRLDYGNGRIGPSAARAWHDGVLTVTLRQQLAFIDRVRRGDLPVSRATLAAVKAAMRDADGRGRSLYAKTGTHLPDDGSPGIGWWIGWEDAGAHATSFVLAVELKRGDVRSKRVALGKRLLAAEDRAEDRTAPRR